jgi:ComF family protein
MVRRISILVHMFREIFSLFYPSLCAACREPLLRNEVTICASCLMELPYTQFHLDAENPVTRLFWGRTTVHFATSLCYFEKATRVQRMLHELKYRGNTSVGDFLGKELGKQIELSPHFGKIDLILPVPLHPKKERLRGYNQSSFIADGISHITGIEAQKSLLLRKKNNSTQTKKSRFDRYKNVETIFTLKEPEQVYGKHVLLVDDVVTTGATLEACTETLLAQPDTRVSIATLAIA